MDGSPVDLAFALLPTREIELTIETVECDDMATPLSWLIPGATSTSTALAQVDVPTTVVLDPTTPFTLPPSLYADPDQFDFQSTAFFAPACLVLTAESTDAAGRPATEVFNTSVNVTVATPCHPGRFNPRDGSNLQTVCSLCAFGQYQPSFGSRSCVTCPANLTRTTDVGSSSVSDCVSCTLGYYCPVGSEEPLPCPGGGYESLAHGLDHTSNVTDCEHLPCLPGYWCGPAAAEGSTYVQMIQVFPMATVVLPVAASGSFPFTVNNLNANGTLALRMSGAPIWVAGISASGALGTVTDASGGGGGADVAVTLPFAGDFSVNVIVDTAVLGSTVTSGVTGIVALEWAVVGGSGDALDSDQLSQLDFFPGLELNVSVDIVTVVVTPDTFFYTADYATTVAQSSSQVQIFNPLW